MIHIRCGNIKSSPPSKLSRWQTSLCPGRHPDFLREQARQYRSCCFALPLDLYGGAQPFRTCDLTLCTQSDLDYVAFLSFYQEHISQESFP
eukprot:1137770-Pelagomonas_calceolata.AAC.1